MAKKVVASLQTEGKNIVKIIKTVRSPKTGAYSFKSEFIPTEKLKEYLSQK